MKLNSLLLYVSDLQKSAKFYKDLGFKVKDHNYFIDAKLDGFILTLVDEKKAYFKHTSGLKNKGAGVYIYLNVDDVDKVFRNLNIRGFILSSEPRNWPWGNREFALRDPDRYILIFSQKIK